jgi:hypothetical protein
MQMTLCQLISSGLHAAPETPALRRFSIVAAVITAFAAFLFLIATVFMGNSLLLLNNVILFAVTAAVCWMLYLYAFLKANLDWWTPARIAAHRQSSDALTTDQTADMP